MSSRPLPRVVWRALISCAAALSAYTVAQAQGTTVAIGGALLDRNAAVWGRLVQLAGGPGACFSIFATGSGTPDESAAAIAANLARHGAKAEHIRVAPRIGGIDLAAEVRSPVWIDKVQGCRGVFFSGGAQERFLDTLQPGGRSTPLLDAVRAVWQRGGVVAGTSSGAAVLSAVAFRDAGDVMAVMKGRLRQGQEWERGFALLPPNVMVDQHFVRRGRIGRLLPLMQAQGVPIGLGVEEDSGAVVRGNEVEAIGSHGVLVADLSGATRDATLPHFNVQGATLHWLQSGDRFDLAKRTVLPSLPSTQGTLLQPAAPGHKGYHRGPAFVADILAEGLIVAAMARLVDSDQRELRALAFDWRPARDDAAPQIGFEWRFSIDEHTRGWLTTQPTAYTLAGVKLDIVPVRMQRPAYEPVLPPPPAKKATP